MGHRLRYLPVMALLLAGWFASALLPARAGDILRIVALRGGIDDGPPVPVADSLGSIVLERVLDILAIVILGAIFAFFTISESLPRWVAVAYGIAVGALVLLALVLVIAPAFMAALRRWWDNRWWQAALSFAERFVTALRSLAQDPAAALLVIGESLVIWLCDAMLLWLALLSLGVKVSFGPAAFVALTVDIVAALPLTPGGVGQIEVATVALLTLLGIPATHCRCGGSHCARYLVSGVSCSLAAPSPSGRASLPSSHRQIAQRGSRREGQRTGRTPRPLYGDSTDAHLPDASGRKRRARGAAAARRRHQAALGQSL